jgi:hypothetical protein
MSKRSRDLVVPEQSSYNRQKVDDPNTNTNKRPTDNVSNTTKPAKQSRNHTLFSCRNETGKLCAEAAEKRIHQGQAGGKRTKKRTSKKRNTKSRRRMNC